MDIYYDDQILSDSGSDCDYDIYSETYEEYDVDNLLYRHEPETKHEFSYNDIILFSVAIIFLNII
uniref:Uncharacterized protein n=1 Tax=Pithovirus LCPAC101 TaxID=2506586 RepID=A0A481Z2I3_9VIRU|nr:MAG: hypothetical protein LCPAC101_01990 [Pithovirus LCPAC101]